MTFWDFLIIAAVGLVLFTLIMGLRQMLSNSEEARKKSNTWMWRRIYAQFFAVGVLAFAMYMKVNSGA